MPAASVTAAQLDRARADGQVVLVDFWASWCGPCRVMAPHFDAAADGPLGEVASLVKVDTEAEQQLAQQVGIRSIPTLVLFDGEREVARTTGALTRAQIEQWATASLA